MPDLTVVDEGEKMAANYVQVTGPVSCIRCDYSTAVEHEMGAPLGIQQELLMGHLSAVHPDWQLEGFKRAAEGEQLKSEHERLRLAVVEAAKVYDAEYFKPSGWAWTHRVSGALLKLRAATRALIAFEAEHKIGEWSCQINLLR